MGVDLKQNNGGNLKKITTLNFFHFGQYKLKFWRGSHEKVIFLLFIFCGQNIYLERGVQLLLLFFFLRSKKNLRGLKKIVGAGEGWPMRGLDLIM